METLNLKLSDSLHNELRTQAKREKISVNKLISSAIGEKLSALDTEDFFRERAAGASRDEFLDALNKVPDSKPLSGDELT